MAEIRELRLRATESRGDVSALLRRPRDARGCLVLAHGAGADMRHAFMEALSDVLASRAIATLRFQFPYSERGRRSPDPRPVLLATVRAALATAAKEASDLPLLAGGKSMGGRMYSLAAAEAPLPQVRGLVFFGFPLHAAGHPSAERGDHLEKLSIPLLFLQGTRDKLADLALLRPLCRKLGGRAMLHVVEGGDHSFHVPKRSGRSDAEVLEELADATEAWAGPLVA